MVDSGVVVELSAVVGVVADLVVVAEAISEVLVVAHRAVVVQVEAGELSVRTLRNIG